MNLVLLSLIGMRGDTFISLSLLDQIFFQLNFLEVKIDINVVNLVEGHLNSELFNP